MNKWIEKLKSGLTSVEHEEGVGRPLTSTTDENNEQAQQMMPADQRITIDELAYSLQISHGSAYQIIHDNFSFRKVSARLSVYSKMEQMHPKGWGLCRKMTYFLYSCFVQIY